MSRSSGNGQAPKGEASSPRFVPAASLADILGKRDNFPQAAPEEGDRVYTRETIIQESLGSRNPFSGLAGRTVHV